MNNPHDHAGKKKDHRKHVPEPPRRSYGFHKDWRLWVIVVMLVAMGVYLLTLDESILPGGGSAPPAPADVAE